MIVSRCAHVFAWLHRRELELVRLIAGDKAFINPLELLKDGVRYVTSISHVDPRARERENLAAIWRLSPLMRP